MEKLAAVGCLTIGNLGEGHRRHQWTVTKNKDSKNKSGKENEENTFQEIADDGKSDEDKTGDYCESLPRKG